jgi:dihydroflavonol-4-reductase
MRALVTGATGFLGSHLARRLCSVGATVRVLVRPTSDRSRLDGLSIEVVEGDVVEAESVDRAVDGADQVFHVAAFLEFGPRDPGMMELVNVGGTHNVLTAAARRQVPVVHVSSVASFGPTGTDERDETYWCDDEPVVAYERTKREAHLLARRFAAEGASVRVAAPGGIYGWGDQSELADLIRAYVLYPIPIGYMPEMVHSTVNVDDCADALVAIADRGVDGEEYILAAETVTLEEWFGHFCAGARRRPPSVYVPSAALRSLSPMLERLASLGVASTDMARETIVMATRHLAFSGAKARRELEWTPRSLADGMAELAVALQAEQLVDRIARARARSRVR